ncbi:SusD/RagB family nutrient-binding outer membrane lipoprotein [Aestuariibaculum suncheonense]|uniref:SusD/RagB family nutrient-binding outer membrane lipoprotein n=1 Tax=Aestuariibaculum suncheonense TaxID=1028745 RepID=A0A8J6U9M2_9FLAO|nr:SusD/RagB family nutrient-binding outer membrane lipoprotein [Aestuariibaculum suncheonense]MBD0834313.1 SusD/RagB family nutrient-binding outer membrane lipoprotein [Aestuariibaculum suncheonense]
MKNIDIKNFSIITLLVLLFACDVDYENNPNEIVDPPTSGLLNDAVKKMMDDLYDEWFMGRFTQVGVQYWTQTAYADEDRYVYRESQRETWEDFYRNLENIRKVIQLNTDENSKDVNSIYGSNNNQIAVARILLSFSFNIMADTWGDIPYYSYGSDDPDFQALNLADSNEEILSPKYAEQSKIYADILKELQEAEAMIEINELGVKGDNIYNGDMELWKKFANSLRLRVAIKIRGIDPSTANNHINDAVNKGVFTSNSDNAGFQYEATDVNAAPFYIAFNVSNRSDFAMSHPFTQLLLGNNLVDHSGNDITDNPFYGMQDPRLKIFAKTNNNGDYVGMPISDNSADAGVYSYESPPGAAIIDTPDYTQYLMEFAEVSFILSEINNWDQIHYENGIKASMLKWGISETDINNYMSSLPAASEASVLTQKYIALYMDAQTAWQEYRRTGYPMTILKPGTEFSVTPIQGTTLDYTFTSLVEGVTDLPYRLQYPDFERTLNGENRSEAVSRLSNGDAINSKLYWDVN